VVFSAADWKQRWTNYDAWSAKHASPDPRDFQSILRDLSFLYRLAPEHLRLNDPDPDKRGVQAYHRVLAAHERYCRRS
jgi:hypothetical protein